MQEAQHEGSGAPPITELIPKGTFDDTPSFLRQLRFLLQRMGTSAMTTMWKSEVQPKTTCALSRSLYSSNRPPREMIYYSYPLANFYFCLYSKKCKHSFSEKAIRDFLRRGPQKCPAAGCTQMIANADIEPNKSLEKKVKAYERRKRMQEEDSGDEEVIE